MSCSISFLAIGLGSAGSADSGIARIRAAMILFMRLPNFLSASTLRSAARQRIEIVNDGLTRAARGLRDAAENEEGRRIRAEKAVRIGEWREHDIRFVQPGPGDASC